MIIGKAEHEGQPALIFGLSHENIARLLKGEPIYHKAHPSMDGKALLIFVGKTEEAMEETLRTGGALTDQTEVHRDNSIR